MSGWKKLAAASAAGGDVLNVEDVFSTYLYNGNGSTQTITNGVDLSGEGGLVWIKCREATYSHQLFDTERGATKYLITNLNNSEATVSNSLTSFNSDGFSLSDQGSVNSAVASSNEFTSWTFRKAPKFFDVVTYTGDGTTGRQISHNLGGEVGALIIKKTNDVGAWIVYHRSLGTSKYMALSSTSAALNFSAVNTVTSTYFVSDNQNASGSTYVAYLFAHNDGDGELYY
jgi:hypothetical protein